MSPTRLCPLCEADVATHMCFSCGYRLCKDCVTLEDGLCPQCGGTVWVDTLADNAAEFRTDEPDEEDEDVVTS